MTEHSYYHDGATAGDAVEAPYSAELYSKLNSIIRSGEDSYVFPFDQNELLVAHTGVAITVDTGSAWIGGVYYNNSAQVTLSLVTNTSPYNRIDRVIIRVNWQTNTAVLAIKTGAPSAYPVPPTLLQEIGDVYEFPLARFYAGLGADYLIDEREFANTALHANRYSNENLFPNSEFMSQEGTGPTADIGIRTPAYWDYGGNALAQQTAKFDVMSRGNTIEVTLPTATNDYLISTMRLINASATTVPVTIRLWIEVLSGEVSFVEDASATMLGTLPVTAGAVEVILRPTVFIAANPTLEFKLVGAVDNTVFKLGQVTLAYGKIGAPLTPRHELVLFGKPYSYDMPTLANGSNIIDLPVSFGTQMLLATMIVGDTGSAGSSTIYAAIQNIIGACNQLRAEIGRLTNSASCTKTGPINFEYDQTGYIMYNAPYQIDFKIAWSGAAAMSASLYFVGLQV